MRYWRNLDSEAIYLIVIATVLLAIIVGVAMCDASKKEDCQDRGGHVVKETQCPMMCTVPDKNGCLLYEPVCDWHCEGGAP